MTSYSLLASSTNLHSLQTGYWSPGNYYSIVCSQAGVSSPLQDSLLPASSAFYLMMSVKLNKHNNIAPTITTKIKASQTNICRFICIDVARIKKTGVAKNGQAK